VSGGFRYFVGAVAFGFAAVWIMATLAGALVCLAATVAGYGAVVVADWTRTKRTARVAVDGTPATSEGSHTDAEPYLEDFPLTPEALNSDLGYVYEPTGAAAREYGWAHSDGAAWS
jgi:hypothetical protein